MNKKILLIFLLSQIFLSVPGFCRPPQKLEFPPLKFAPPHIRTHTLPNGVTLYFLQDKELPLISLSLTVRTGTQYESSSEAGLASLCGTMIRAGGTQTRKVEEINEELEFLGASVESSIDTEQAGASLSVLKKDLDRGLEIFADILLNPAFDPAKLEIEKSKLIETIRRRNDEPYPIARREFRKILYGPTHPFSRTAEIPTVRQFTRNELLEFYQRYFQPNNTAIAISGDFEPEQIISKLQTLFKNWKPTPVTFPKPEYAAFSTSTYKVVGYAERPINQTSIIIGSLGIKRHNPDRFTLEVMNEILGGGGFSSRLYKEVRSHLGLAYWVGSSISEPYDYGIIAAVCQTKNSAVGQTIKAILAEFQRIRTEKVTEEELKLAKNAIINSFVFRYSSPHAIVAQKLSQDYFGFPSDYLETYTQKIAAVTTAQVLAAAQKYINPDKFTIMIVGNAKEFDLQPSVFGAVRPADLKIPE